MDGRKDVIRQLEAYGKVVQETKVWSCQGCQATVGRPNSSFLIFRLEIAGRHDAPDFLECEVETVNNLRASKRE